MIHTERAERDSLGFRVLEIEADLSETEIETQFASRANGIMDIFRSRQVQAFLARPKTKNQISADQIMKTKARFPRWKTENWDGISFVCQPLQPDSERHEEVKSNWKMFATSKWLTHGHVSLSPTSSARSMNLIIFSHGNSSTNTFARSLRVIWAENEKEPNSIQSQFAVY